MTKKLKLWIYKYLQIANLIEYTDVVEPRCRAEEEIPEVMDERGSTSHSVNSIHPTLSQNLWHNHLHKTYEIDSTSEFNFKQSTFKH